MRNILLASLLFLIACTSSNQHGDCVGAFEKQNPNKEYKVQSSNIVWGIIFFETMIVPAIVILNETYCPIGDK